MTAEDAYQGERGEDYQRAVHGDVIESGDVLTVKARLAAHRYFSDLSPAARVFEFGVGMGTNLAALPNEVRDGYDIGEFAREASRKRGLRVFESLDDAEPHSYDLVVCRHVLEHVEEPASVLRDLRKLLARGGQLLLILPVEKTSHKPSDLPDVDVNRHLFAWGPQQIVNLLDVAGYRPVRHHFFWYSMQGKLRWIVGFGGLRAYSRAVTLAGRIKGQAELAIWVGVDD